MGLHPHPVGPVSHSVPTLEGARLDGIQPKHRENLQTPTTEDYE